MRKMIVLLSMVGAAASVQAQDAETETENGVELDGSEFPILEVRGGYRIEEGCSRDEQDRIHAAMGVLLDRSNAQFGRFSQCIQSAPLVEFNCPSGQSRDYIIRQFADTQFTNIRCYSGAAENALAEAPVAVSGTRLSIDHGFLANGGIEEIAAVVGHEIMHNRGYRHQQHEFGTQYYDNTVPQQVRACIQFLAPHPSRGPLTREFDDRCDGGDFRTIRNDMQACPVGMYMTGLHEDAGRALCAHFPGRSYATGQEFVDSTTSQFGMDNCPPGYAMTGVHIKRSVVMCAPFSDTTRWVEPTLRRQGMMACPVGAAMTGLHAKDAKVTCQWP